MYTVDKIRKLCLNSGFLSTSKSAKDSLRIGPCGYLLLENLKNEWILNNVIIRDLNIFFNKDNISSNELYSHVHKTMKQSLPFGVAEIIEDINLEKNKSTSVLEDFFKPNKHTILKCRTFVSSESSIHFFHNWQRQRMMWWRKFSASPGRYNLTDIIQNDSINQSVEINSTFPWGTCFLEKISLETFDDELFTTEKCDNEKIHCVINESDLLTMLLNMLCDAYDTPLFKGKPREMMRLHRKLAPYKINFVIIYEDDAIKEELIQLGQYLCKLLRTKHISTLYNPNIFTICKLVDGNFQDKEEKIKNITESSIWYYNDQLGIPYTILLRENVLNNGICGLRSRDTTLEEEVHISDLTTYVERLLEKY